MKKAFAILLAMVFVLSGTFSATAAAQPQAKTVYVASKPIPTSAAEAARDWFSNRMPAQDICDWTNLTVEQVKKVKLCRAFIVEYFEAKEYKQYIFPLLYENKFVATLLISGDKESGYSYQLGGGDDFLESLNTLPSSPTAPLMFAYTNDSCYVIDSKNKVHLIRTYFPYTEAVMERQMRDMTKMERPERIRVINAATAYPVQISSQQIATEEPVLTVKDETNKLIYQSDDGGKTWRNNAKPLMHMSIEKTVYPKADGKIAYTVHNNTKNEQGSDEYFSLQKWNGQKWVKMPESDSLWFNDIGWILAPNSSTSGGANWGRCGIKLEAGQYKLIKKLSAEGRQFTCEAVFVLE